jgi:hypothetical protein
MARNFVEYHIQEGAFHTFKVKAGQTIKIGQFVEVSGDREVSVASAGSNKVIGQVYSGTVGLDGLTDGYKGDNGDVVTVIALKPLTYVEAGTSVVAGDNLKANTSGNVVKLVEGTDSELAKVAVALQGGASGERILAMLG